MVCIFWLITLTTLLITTDAHQEPTGSLGNQTHQELTGSLGNQTAQKTLLMHDIVKCIGQPHRFSLKKLHSDMLWCVKKEVSHCIPKQPLVDLTSFTLITKENKSYCGSIWTKEKHAATHFVKDMLITVFDKHYLHFSIVYFNFSLSRYLLCSQHALVLTSERNELFCGIRIPWTFILHQNRASLKLIIAKYRHYHFKLVYISFTTNWLSQISILKKAHYLPGQMGTISWNIFDVKIKSYKYYITTSPHNILSIHLSINNIMHNIFMQIYDGPGPISKIIFNLQKEKPFKNRLIRSTAFSAFAIIEPISGNTYTSFKMIMSSEKQTHMPFCDGKLTLIRKQTWEHVFESRHWKNTYCHFTQSTRSWNLDVYVVSYTFSGPNMITDISPYTCQYGGLLIYIGESYFTICENVHDVRHSGKAIGYAFVWFAGYSHGKIKLRLWKNKCSTLYAELSPSWDISKTEVEMTLPKSTGCTFFICPPPNTDKKTKCTIKLNNYPSLGTTLIAIAWTKTYISKFCHKKYEVTSNYFQSDKWPFIVRNNVGYRRYEVPNKPLHVYHYYLYNATIALLQTHCWADPYFNRLLVNVRISSCEYDERRNQIEYFLIDGTIPLRGCRNTIDVMAQPGLKNIEYIYRDTGLKNSFLERIDMKYNIDCPKDCRRYKYHIYALDTDGETVVQYIADVGTVIFTHYDHRGFRINLSLDDDLPARCLISCGLVLTLTPLGKSHGLPSWKHVRFRKRR